MSIQSSDQKISLRNKNVLRKIHKFTQAGIENVMIVADFDGTLSIAAGANRKYKTTFGTAKLHLGKEHERKSVSLYDHYHKFEYSADITKEQRRIKMKEWCQKAMQLIVDYKFNRQTIDNIVQQQNITPRPGLNSFINFAKNNEIPLWIASAGLGDIISSFLKNISNQNEFKIHSNFFDFDNRGTAISFDKQKSVYVQNKHNTIKEIPEYNNCRKDKPLQIILGDSVDDIKLAENRESALSFGFLDDKIEERKNAFQSTFDIVIEDKGSLDIIQKILNNEFY